MKKIKRKKPSRHKNKNLAAPKEFADETCDGDEGCTMPVVHRIDCITCDRLGKAPVCGMHTCPIHHDQVREKMKAHAVTSHPVNMLRAFGAMLRGRDIT